MNTTSFIPILEKLAEILSIQPNILQLRQAVSRLDLKEDTAAGYLKALTDTAAAVNLTFITQEFSKDEIEQVYKQLEFPIVAFSDLGGLAPVVLYKGKNGLQAWRMHDDQATEIPSDRIPELLEHVLSYSQFEAICQNKSVTDSSESPSYFTLSPVELKSMFGDSSEHDGESIEYTPLLRFWKFVTSERKIVFYIYIYAIIIGIINLSLPLGIQAIIGRISGGLLFDGVVVLIVFVILGIALAGGLQIMQIYLVEVLQRRIMANAAFEFAFRIPRIKSEALLNLHAPELMNRFFDVLTLQKGFSKVLLDLTTAVLQIIFGLLLLAFYHNSFVIFGIFLLFLLLVFFRITGPKGLKTSLKESKQKYKIVSWFEEIARTVQTFKLSGNSPIAMDRTDENINHYLIARKSHFKVLVGQFITIAIFKLLVTGGTLIIGCLLVVNREITLGQFVASEIIIILILGAVEKIILNMDTIYDVLTAVEKIAQVTDLPLESQGGISLSSESTKAGIQLKVEKLKFTYPGKSEPTLNTLDFEIKPGERVCVAGPKGSGKTTLSNVLTGMYSTYQGQVTIQGIPIRNLRKSDLRELISGNSIQDELFEGSIEENIRLGNQGIRNQDIMDALRKADAIEGINSLSDGIYTKLLPGGKGLSNSLIRRIQLARCLVAKPKLLVYNDFFDGFASSEKHSVLNTICSVEGPNSVLAFSNDTDLMQHCDRVILLDAGKLVAEGTYESLKNHPVLLAMFNSQN